MASSEEVDTAAGEHSRLRMAVGRLEGLLVPGERLEAWTIQRRVFALTRRRTLVAATSGRLIVMHRKLFGGFHLQDIRWQDLKDARLDVGLLGADLTVAFLTGGDLAVSGEPGPTLTLYGLRKRGAQDVYKICQTYEQAWREKRRIRELEELRARSGGIQLGSMSGVATTGSNGAGQDDPVARLERAKEMLHKGLITDSEFEAIKAKVVSGL